MYLREKISTKLPSCFDITHMHMHTRGSMHKGTHIACMNACTHTHTHTAHTHTHIS